MAKNKFPPLSEVMERLDKNVQSTSARALGSIRVSWSDAVVMRDALRAGDELARQATETVRALHRLERETRDDLHDRASGR